MKDCTIKETADILNKADTLALTAHINSDGDALGSLLGLGAILEKLGKKVHLFIDDDLPQQFSFMPGFKKIKRPDRIEKVDALVILDASDFERIGKVAEHVQSSYSINIDHHVSNSGITDYRLLDAKAAATCELVFALAQALNVTIDRDTAICLYAGISSDCGSFRYANTTANTLRIAAQLIDYGVQPNEISDYLETQTVENLHLLPKVLETLEFFLDNKVAAITIMPDLYKNNIDSESFIKYPRYIEGIEVAILFKGITGNATRVSMRSKHIDVSKIALEFGGGGHIRASGCTIHGDVDTAKDAIIAAIAKYI